MASYSYFRPKQKNKGIALLLSFLITGAGQLYADTNQKGFLLICISFILVALTTATGGLLSIVLIPYWIWGMYDAAKEVDNYNNQSYSRTARQNTSSNYRKSDSYRVKDIDDDDAFRQRDRINDENNKLLSDDFINRLKKLSRLRESNVLDEEEFQSQKRKLIDSFKWNRQVDKPEDFLSELIPLIEDNSLNESEVKEIKNCVLR